MSLSFDRDGAQLFAAALSATEVDLLRDRADLALGAEPGARLTVDESVSAILATNGSVGRIAVDLIGERARPVRAVIFDKTEDANWAVAWHQDRTIVVRGRVEVDGFGPWSMKKGLLHVAPPAEVLAGMATLRLHLDPCGPDNAPLLAASGSHRLGRVAAADAEAQAKACGMVTCLAETGDVWAYSTLILHASARAAQPMRRRVLQVDYAPRDLPGGLAWRGVDDERAT